MLPAATEWVCAFGGAGDLVARSHLCDYPGSIRAVPVVTRPLFDAAGEDSAGIDRQVGERIARNLSLNEIDLDRLAALRPDVIIAQDDCLACAPFAPDIPEGLSPRTELFAPMTLKQVIDGALRLGRTIGRMEEAMRWLSRAEKRLALLRHQIGLERRADESVLPSAVCIEWLDPLMAAAHWTPDLIRMAGGRPLLGESGIRATTVEWDHLLRADPDVLMIAACGYPVDRTLSELTALTARPGWTKLLAVRNGAVFVMDGSAYVNRPGPRLYRSMELLATAFYPEKALMEELQVQDWELRRVYEPKSLRADEPMSL